ncbi:unnamed protein product [Absidia cylindrospora]
MSALRQAGTRLVDSVVIIDKNKHFYGKVLFYCTVLVDGVEQILAALLPLKGVNYPIVNDDDETNECRIFPTWDCRFGVHPRLVFVDAMHIVNVFGLLQDCEIPNKKNIITQIDVAWKLSYLTPSEIRIL